jgi:hypothetical protein
MDPRMQGLAAQLGLHSKLFLNIGQMAMLRRYTGSAAISYR